MHYELQVIANGCEECFLERVFNEEVFVEQPKGFQDPYFQYHVLRLKKALYGLKQVPRAWYDRLTTYLLDHDHLAHEFSEEMKREFEMSMVRELNYFLGLQVKQQKDGIFIS